VSANDIDDGDNSRIVYSLLDGQGKFTINRTSGEIFLDGVVDHEIQDTYNVSHNYILHAFKHWLLVL